MNIQLFYNNAENNRVDKTSYLRKIADLNGTLRNETSIINPVITIELNDDIIKNLVYSLSEIIDDNGSSVITVGTINPPVIEYRNKILSSNYAYIPNFNRYYYINDIISLGNNFWSIVLSVDVLMSFKEQIYMLTCWIDRNEFDFDTSLPDNLLPIKNGNNILKVDCIPPSDIPYKLKLYEDLSSDTDACVLLQVAGNVKTFSGGSIHNSTPFNNMYVMTLDQLNNILALMCSYNWASELSQLFSEPTNSLVSAKILPFVITREDGGVGLRYTESKNITIANVIKTIYDNESTEFLRWIIASEPIKLSLGTITYNIPSDFTFIYYQPYANCQLFLPYYGFTDIDINLFIKNNKVTIKIDYWIDVPSGVCTCVLYNEDNVKCHILEFNIAVELPLGRSNATEVTRNVLLSSIKLATSFAVASGNFFSASNNIVSANNLPANTSRQKTIKNIDIERAVRQRNTEYSNAGTNMFGNFAIDFINSSQSKLSGGNVSANLNAGYIDSDPLHITTFIPYLLFKLPNIALDVSDLPEYAHMVGRPCHKFNRLLLANGFTVVGSCHLEEFTTATNGELEEIENTLKSGIILEEHK